MARVTTKELAELIGQLRAELAAFSERLARVEAALPAQASPAPAQAAPPVPAPAGAEAAAPAGRAAIPEEILPVISAAVAAFLGVRAQVRQVRLVRSHAWAQQGRVSIQASHRLQ